MESKEDLEVDGARSAGFGLKVGIESVHAKHEIGRICLCPKTVIAHHKITAPGSLQDCRDTLYRLLADEGRNSSVGRANKLTGGRAGSKSIGRKYSPTGQCLSFSFAVHTANQQYQTCDRHNQCTLHLFQHCSCSPLISSELIHNLHSRVDGARHTYASLKSWLKIV